MIRWLAGTFDPSGRAAGRDPACALGGGDVVELASGALRLAYSGPERPHGSELCLLDGFLDNAAELAEELSVANPHSVEDLLLIGWRRWREELPRRMRGDFLLLVWDGEHGTGMLARDQLGARPLLLCERSGTLHFASEMRHLLALLPSRPAPDPAGVAHWLTMSARPGTGTMFSGVRRLAPGAMLLLDSECARERRYWAPRYIEPLELPVSEAALAVRSALDISVSRRLTSEGLTGVLMSGGLDSSAVAATASVVSGDRVRAFAATFPEHPAVDESALIGELRGELRLGGADATVRAGGLLASAIEATEAWQLPLRSWGDFWALPLLRAARAEGVKTMLGGDGGDEVFGVRAYLLADELRAGRPLGAYRLAHELPGARDGPPRRELLAILAEVALGGALPPTLQAGLTRIAPGAERPPQWLRPKMAQALRDSDDPYAWKRLDGPRWWTRTAFELTLGLEATGIFEHQRQRAALAGLESRHPMLDMDLVELMLQQSPRASFDPHRNRPLLRAALAERLPDTVRMRPQKAQFDALVLDCLHGADGAAIRTLLGDPKAELGAYVDLAGVRRAVFGAAQQQTTQPFRWMWQLWRLVSAECWLRRETGGQDSLQAIAASVPDVSIAKVGP